MIRPTPRPRISLAIARGTLILHPTEPVVQWQCPLCLIVCITKTCNLRFHQRAFLNQCDVTHGLYLVKIGDDPLEQSKPQNSG